MPLCPVDRQSLRLTSSTSSPMSSASRSPYPGTASASLCCGDRTTSGRTQRRVESGCLLTHRGRRVTSARSLGLVEPKPDPLRPCLRGRGKPRKTSVDRTWRATEPRERPQDDRQTTNSRASFRFGTAWSSRDSLGRSWRSFSMAAVYVWTVRGESPLDQQKSSNARAAWSSRHVRVAPPFRLRGRVFEGRIAWTTRQAGTAFLTHSGLPATIRPNRASRQRSSTGRATDL